MARYGGPGRAKAVFFTRPSMLVGPMLAPPITRGRNGGAAGNRTRVRSAYYKRVYRHSPGEPEQDQYRLRRRGIEGRTATSGRSRVPGGDCRSLNGRGRGPGPSPPEGRSIPSRSCRRAWGSGWRAAVRYGRRAGQPKHGPYSAALLRAPGLSAGRRRARQSRRTSRSTKTLACNQGRDQSTQGNAPTTTRRQSRVGRPSAVHCGVNSPSASQRSGSTSDWIAAVMKGRFRFATVSSAM